MQGEASRSSQITDRDRVHARHDQTVVGNRDAATVVRQQRSERTRFRRTHPHTGASAVYERGNRRLHDQPAMVDDHYVVREQRKLSQNVTRHENCRPALRVVPQETTHPMHTGRVEAVGRLVQNQEPGVANQGSGETQTLTHAERELTSPFVGGGVESDLMQNRVNPCVVDSDGGGTNAEFLAAAATGMEPRRVDQCSDEPSRVVEAAIRLTENARPPARRLGETDEDAQRRGLTGAVWAEEAGHPSRRDRKAQVVDRVLITEGLGEVFDDDWR